MTAAIACSTPRVSPAYNIGNPCFLKLLIFSQDRPLGHVYVEAASTLGYSAVTASNAEQAQHLIDTEKIDVVLIDLNPLTANSLEILREMKAHHPEIQVIATGTSGTADFAVHVMKMGACDYLAKPFGLEELRIRLEAVAALLKSKTENRLRREQLKTHQGFAGIIGRTGEMEKLYRLISKASQSSHPVLILGESGAGKEMVARNPLLWPIS